MCLDIFKVIKINKKSLLFVTVNCLDPRNYLSGRFCAKKHNMFAFLGSSEALFGVIMFPDVENSLSHGTLVAGIHNSRWAIFESTG